MIKKILPVHEGSAVYARERAGRCSEALKKTCGVA